MWKRPVVTILVLMTGMGATLARGEDNGPIEVPERNVVGKATELPLSGVRGSANEDGRFLSRAEGTNGSPGGGAIRERGGRPRRKDKGPEAGGMAPAFKLRSLDGKQEFDLAAFRGRKPVILFFGSYT